MKSNDASHSFGESRTDPSWNSTLAGHALGRVLSDMSSFALLVTFYLIKWNIFQMYVPHVLLGSLNFMFIGCYSLAPDGVKRDKMIQASMV